MVNTIAGANILDDVGDGNLPESVSVLIIGLVALVVGLFGYQVVHKYERYSWIVMLVCFCIVAGFGAKHFVNVPMGTGAAETSSVLSFGTAIIGFQISWTTIAADYAVYIRETTKPWKVCLWTWSGLFFSQFLIELLGAALMTTINGSDAFTAAYNARGVGGLTGQIFEGYGTGVRNFGKFIQAILSFSVVAVVITNVYSLGLNVQMISSHLIKVPRLIWSLIGGAAFLIAAIAGRNHLQEVMEDFLNVIAYWLTPFLAIMLLEHLCFRRGYAYDITAWEDPKKLPYGFAAFTVFCIGTVLAILCMSQVWWVGPIALAVGNAPYGTDISWELALGATIVLYVPLRWLERRMTGF
jgi:purine-cytosine permease-like protein